MNNITAKDLIKDLPYKFELIEQQQDLEQRLSLLYCVVGDLVLLTTCLNPQVHEDNTDSAANRWVRCEDALPNDEGEYITVRKEGSWLAYHIFSFYPENPGQWTNGPSAIIAWTPLPKYTPVVDDLFNPSNHSINADGSCNLGCC